MTTGIGVVRDNELKLEDGEASHTRSSSRTGVIRCNIRCHPTGVIRCNKPLTHVVVVGQVSSDVISGAIRQVSSDVISLSHT
jgi:hypothetical protein